VARKLRDLQREPEELQRQLAKPVVELPTAEEMRALIERRAQDFAAAQSEPASMRDAVRALVVVGEQLAVSADQARGFRVEGLVAVPLQRQTPGISENPGRLEEVVAGEGFATVRPAPHRVSVQYRWAA
jgi:hypothetical protein